MTDRFKDSAGSALSFVPVEVDEGATTPVFVASVPCVAGRVLKADPDAGLTVEARRTGSGAPFVNIATAPVDLTPFAPATVSFDFRITAGAVSGDSPLQAVIRRDHA
jgi:hypothetical protein